jgi:hypothetical protein
VPTSHDGQLLLFICTVPGNLQAPGQPEISGARHLYLRDGDGTYGLHPPLQACIDEQPGAVIPQLFMSEAGERGALLHATLHCLDQLLSDLPTVALPGLRNQ